MRPARIAHKTTKAQLLAAPHRGASRHCAVVVGHSQYQFQPRLLEQASHARNLVRDTLEQATQEQKAPPKAGLIVGDPLFQACHAADFMRLPDYV